MFWFGRKKKLIDGQKSGSDIKPILVREIRQMDDPVSQHLVNVFDLIKTNEQQWSPGQVIYDKIEELTLDQVLSQIGMWYTYDNLDNIESLLTASSQPNWVDEMLRELGLACRTAQVENAFALETYLRNKQ